jgi:cupin superfamily acireductone dioxygenase involved in methionine salvage
MQKSSLSRLSRCVNKKILHILYEDMYVIIHIPKGIYHIVPFRITQACGVKNSSHFVKIRLFGTGCKIKLKRWLGKQNESGLNINGFHQK